MPGPVVREIEAKSILNPSKIYDYCVNPYTGCQVACAYCYAALFMRRYSGHSEPWGEFVDAKVNAPALLARQIVRAKRGTVWFASVCDPYQPLEERFALTRRSLEVLAGRDFPVVIQTKSARVRRDLDVIRRIRRSRSGSASLRTTRRSSGCSSGHRRRSGSGSRSSGVQGGGHLDLRFRRTSPAGKPGTPGRPPGRGRRPGPHRPDELRPRRQGLLRPPRPSRRPDRRFFRTQRPG